MTEAQIISIREKARNKRYKKPINKEINLETIRSSLYDISSECCEVAYLFESGDDLFCDLLGGEEQLYEFKFMFSGLSADCEQMLEDLEYAYIPKWFDIFLAAISDESGSSLGWDYCENSESDYFGLTDRYENRQVIEEAKKKVEHFTKAELIDGARQCFRITFNYLSLKSRYEDLKASMDIIRDTNKAELDVLKHINELYEKADISSNGFKYLWEKDVADLDKLFQQIDPYSQIWLQ